MKELYFSDFPALTTKRLRLRALETKDQSEIFELRSDKTIAKYLDRPLCNSLQEAQKFIEKISAQNNYQWYYWAITSKKSNTLLGTICLWNFSQNKKLAEVGYEMRTNFQGKGYVKEGLQKVLEFGFQNLNLYKIKAEITPDNKNSLKMLQKFNFSICHSLAIDKPTVLYELNKQNFKLVEKNLNETR